MGVAAAMARWACASLPADVVYRRQRSSAVAVPSSHVCSGVRCILVSYMVYDNG